MSGAITDSLVRVAGAYIAWDSHIGSHWCPAAAGEGSCEAGDEILRRLHSALFQLDQDERRMALEAVREWDWEDEAPYPKDSA